MPAGRGRRPGAMGWRSKATARRGGGGERWRKRAIFGASILLGLAACAAPTSRDAQVLGEISDAVSGGVTYEIKFPSLQNKCTDVSSNSGADGANVQLWVCNGSSAQKWIAQDMG